MPQQQTQKQTPTPPQQQQQQQQEERSRKREWNRGPLTEIFPRIPNEALERLLDLVIAKGVTYNLSESKRSNARKYTGIVVAHVRHNYSDYDGLLRDQVERYEARRRSGGQVWRVLREWCPWDRDNEVLERCFKATLLAPNERDPGWDPMDVDDESDLEGDPMDLD